MGYLERRGEMWLKTDKNGQPEYGFYAPGEEGNHLVKFIPMTDEKIDEIILPYALGGKERISDGTLQAAMEVLLTNDPNLPYAKHFARRMVAKYLRGETVIEPSCFSGCIQYGDSVTLVAPFSQSIAIHHNAFDNDVLSQEPVKLVLPNSSLMYVRSHTLEGDEYQDEAWALIGNKAVNGTKIRGLDGKMYCSQEKPNYRDFNFVVIKPNGDGNSSEMQL